MQECKLLRVWTTSPLSLSFVPPCHRKERGKCHPEMFFCPSVCQSVDIYIPMKTWFLGSSYIFELLFLCTILFHPKIFVRFCFGFFFGGGGWIFDISCHFEDLFRLWSNIFHPIKPMPPSIPDSWQNNVYQVFQFEAERSALLTQVRGSSMHQFSELQTWLTECEYYLRQCFEFNLDQCLSQW